MSETSKPPVTRGCQPYLASSSQDNHQERWIKIIQKSLPHQNMVEIHSNFNSKSPTKNCRGTSQQNLVSGFIFEDQTWISSDGNQ